MRRARDRVAKEEAGLPASSDPRAQGRVAVKKILKHLELVVRPALREYAAAESNLTSASKIGDGQAIEDAKDEVLRKARTAASELNHLSDVILKEPCAELSKFADLFDIRQQASDLCTFLRSQTRVDDIALVRDISEAFKHHRPDRSTNTVASSEAIIACQQGFGKLRWGEGKFGGTLQAVVTRKNGDERALSSVFQNAFDAYLRLLKQPLLPINEY